MNWIKENKGVIAILTTLITLGGTILYKVSKIEFMAVENTEYRKASEDARNHFSIEFGKFSEKLDILIRYNESNSNDIKVLKTDFDEYKDSQDEIIRRFYYLNKSLKDPRLHSAMDTIPLNIVKFVNEYPKEETVFSVAL